VALLEANKMTEADYEALFTQDPQVARGTGMLQHFSTLSHVLNLSYLI